MMTKDVFVIEIPKNLDQEFRKEVKKEGKQFNLALEEAITLWLKKNSEKKEEVE